MSKSYT